MLNDLKIGAKGEDLVISTLEKHGLTCIKTTKKSERSFWDILISEGPPELLDLVPFYGEVKHDVMAKKTGNVAIEFYNPKSIKPSGIGATKADIWFHVMEGEVWSCSVPLLKQFILDTPPTKTITTGGDNNSSMYIYKKSLILGPLMKNIVIFSKAEFITWLMGQI